MTTALRPVAFRTYAPEFDAVLGDDPCLSRVAEVDAHEGVVYFADENALYFTTLPKPGADGASSVQIKRLALAQRETSVVVADANAANGGCARTRPMRPSCAGVTAGSDPHRSAGTDAYRWRRRNAQLGPPIAPASDRARGGAVA